jgi:hypothetical protein
MDKDEIFVKEIVDTRSWLHRFLGHLIMMFDANAYLALADTIVSVLTLALLHPATDVMSRGMSFECGWRRPTLRQVSGLSQIYKGLSMKMSHLRLESLARNYFLILAVKFKNIH